MLRTGEGETEILLGNKQLLGIFFVVAVLLGIAFYGGYMVGRGPTPRKAVVASTGEPGPTAHRNATAGETHSFPADTSTPGDRSSTASNGEVRRAASSDTAAQSEEPPLGSPQRRQGTKLQPSGSDTTAGAAYEGFEPQAGEEFLQVAAVTKDEAVAVADVLHKKGFSAHAVPKPSNPKIYRVLIGPIRDAGDLSSTRDALRRTGFREVIVQHY